MTLFTGKSTDRSHLSGNIGIAPENVKSRTGQVTRRTASLRKKSDGVEAEKGPCRTRATRRRNQDRYQTRRYAMICVVGMSSCRPPFHAFMLGSDRNSRGWVGFWSRAGLPVGLPSLTGWPCYLTGRSEEDREGELWGAND